MNSVFITSDGANIHFQKKGTGKAIVFIHGFSLNHSMWDEQVAYFSKHYQVITYDMRGFGSSSLPTGPYSHHEDLLELLQYIGVRQTHLVGLSLGGEVAVDFTLKHPEFVSRLVLVDSSLGGYKSTVDWDVRGQSNDVEQAKEKWLLHTVFSPSMLNMNSKGKLEQLVRQYKGWHWFHKDPWVKITNPTAMERLDEIRQPVLIMVGEHDLSYFKDIADFMEKNIEHAKKVIIPDAGHMGNIENSNYFHEQLDQFFHE